MFDHLNRAWAGIISRHPHIHIWASIAVIALFSAHLVNLKIENDIRASFSPASSQATYESLVYKEFYNLTTLPQRAFMLFSAKDGGSMLRYNQLSDVHKMHEEFMSVLRKRDSQTGDRGCDPLCNLNRPFHIISSRLLDIYANKTSRKDMDKFLLDYPVSMYRDVPLFIGMNLLGPSLTNGKIFPQNNSRIVSVRTIILWYFSRSDTTELKDRLRKATLALFESAKKGKHLQYVDFEIFGDEIANSEMVRGAIEATVLMTIGFLLLLVFITFTIYRKMKHMSKWAIPVVVFASVLCPFLASLAAFGALTWLGFYTYTIMCVTPFLICGIGVDDAFILLQSWNQHQNIHDLRRRLALVMVHVGPSISITSLTNSVAFGIGYATPTPQMSLFCLCTSIAVFLDYLLTFTLLAPIILLVSPKDKQPVATNSQTSTNLVPSVAADSKTEIPMAIRKYSAFLHSTTGRIIAFMSLILLYIVALMGVLNMKSNFEPSKAFPSDSPLSSSMASIRAVFDEFFPINVIVNRPPDITDVQDYAHFNRMLWKFLGMSNYSYKPSYDHLDLFLEQLDYPPTIKLEKLQNGTKALKAFQFTVIAKEMSEWSTRAMVEQQVRDILSGFPEFNATIYDGDSAVLNLLLTVKIDLIGSITVTVVCMVIICSFFIPDQIGVGIIGLTISSICFTLVGLISWWGADLDPVTIVDVLLATGFSVDYTAHVAHQFYTKSGKTEERIGMQLLLMKNLFNLNISAISLHEMMSPMLAAGTSTVLCMLPLFLISTYAIVAFAKTVLVVVTSGLAHGLFFMPVLLCCMTPRDENQLLQYCWAKSVEKHKSPAQAAAATRAGNVPTSEPLLSLQTTKTDAD
ncbi:patched family domain-containing protein [Ditylenchus destructor]|uniref:Patched family domain-containing protein n=1 Tax=Ditylenchus destructor TaxID=166010 RepID=A0AAD4NGS7_9BILA|nr:patched family domain-containing protein [Ditylenchus destructor]